MNANRLTMIQHPKQNIYEETEQITPETSSNEVEEVIERISITVN